MDEQRERGVAGRVGKEQVDGLARARAIGEAEFGVLFRLHPLAIGGRLAFPAGKDFRMVRHARAIVVLGLIVNRHGLTRAPTIPESDLG